MVSKHWVVWDFTKAKHGGLRKINHEPGEQKHTWDIWVEDVYLVY